MCSPTSEIWLKLPTELKFMVIERLDRDTRMCLRECSVSSKLLVDECPVRVLEYLTLCCFNDKYILEMDGRRNVFATRSREKAERILERKLRFVEDINTLTFYIDSESLPLTPRLGRYPIKVRHVIFFGHNSSNEAFQRSVVPTLGLIDHRVHLKSVQLDTNNSNGIEMFDTPQVQMASEVENFGTDVNDTHLLKLTATKVTLRSEEITLSGVNKYIKEGVVIYIQKCLLDLNTKEYKFEFFCKYSPNPAADLLEGLNIFRMRRNEVVVNTPFPDYQIKIVYDSKYVHGGRIPKILDHDVIEMGDDEENDALMGQQIQYDEEGVEDEIRAQRFKLVLFAISINALILTGFYYMNWL